MTTSRPNLLYTLLSLGLICAASGLVLLFAGTPAAAQDTPTFHPTFMLLDADGSNVLTSGAPASTMKTCGTCHDTEFIASHSQHADAGLSVFSTDGGSARVGENRTGLYDGWNPIVYRYLSQEGDARLDLTTAEWIQVYGVRHVGGGPAEFSPSGVRLTDLTDSSAAAQGGSSSSSELIPGDWRTSGVVEMNCFLCHVGAPNNAARISALQAGTFGWANSATLSGTGIIEQAGDNWRWNNTAFNPDGSVRADLIRVQDPTSDNCGQCHGLVQTDNQTPLTLTIGEQSHWDTLTTGQVFSPQMLTNSGLNLQDKNEIARTWDVHAERVVACTDCHYALNNPVFYTETNITRPDHLIFDPRRMDFGDYLYRPLHEFANSGAETITDFGSAQRSCASCHEAVSTHTWLPYAERHTEALACETCHVPTLYGPALESVDWTALNPDSTPLMSYRGVEYEGEGALFTGFQPVLLPADDDQKLAPYNLVSAWYWVYGDPARPVPLRDLQAVWFEDGVYAPAILAVFDADADGRLSAAELKVDSETKIALLTERLKAIGLINVRIVGEVQPYAIHHNVTHDEWAVRECNTCHADSSRLNAPITLTTFMPGGVEPVFVDGDTAMNGSLSRSQDGALYYQPTSSAAPVNLYVLGHDYVFWIDLLGMVLFLSILAGISIHAGLRYRAARKGLAHQPAPVRQVYMYGVYERQWHWLQTLAIFGLLFTGLVIHRPNIFGAFSFPGVVLVHNALAILLVINAALAAFYHLASGEIRQFLPRPYGFFDQAFAQAKYYLGGIFRHEAHPFEKTRDRKMNPLQQVTYLLILNVLLPLQVITGALMWGAQHFPELTQRLGGLPFLAPFHTLIAWSFASFIVMHVYLTTTGRTPMANIKAMLVGWEDVEAPTESVPELNPTATEKVNPS